MIYQARALFNAINGTIAAYNDRCYNEIAQKEASKETSASQPTKHKQNLSKSLLDQRAYYTVAPNPNNGTFSIHSTIKDDNDVMIEVTDLVGKSIISKRGRFTFGKVNLTLPNVTPGIYKLSISDGTSSYNFLVTVQ